MDQWRNNFKGAYYLDEEKGFNFGGAVDDIWQKPNGELILADVKATSKNLFDWRILIQNMTMPMLIVVN